ncbi:MAG: hypothetical protein ACOYOO_15470 [Saprospiraceae bacterium]|jgi:hypothetical protein
MNIRSVFFLFLVAATFCRCADPGKSEVRAEAQQLVALMQIHDEVMPMMGELAMLTGQLKALLQEDSLAAPEVRRGIATAVAEMEAAEAGMMDWMAAFRQPETLRATMGHDAIMRYLAAERRKIETVSVQIKSGIEKGKILKMKYL